VTIPPHASAREKETVEEIRVDVDGLAMHALANGPDDGPLVVLLHGFPELARSWRHQLDLLGAAGYRAVAPDQRGYGDTEARGPYDPGTLARDAVGLVRALGRDRATFVGHDVGGAVAWVVAQRHPGVVERLAVLNCPPPSVLAREVVRNPRQLRRSWYIAFFQVPLLPERRMARDHAAVVARALVGGSHVRSAWAPDELDAYRSAFARPGRSRAAIAWYRAGVRSALLPRRTRGLVTCPTLVVWGLRDRFLDPALVEPAKLSRVMAPGNEPEIVLLEDAGHFVQNEAPEQVGAALTRWLGPPRAS
jgi:pimeloyl-ACP methyl ester carboxylesterase